MLRGHIVCGVRDENIQQGLLAEGNLTLQKALDIAQAVTPQGKDSLQATAVSGFSRGTPM